jgi:ABC-type phosphate/phosphonate transport system substrate-binding protein
VKRIFFGPLLLAGLIWSQWAHSELLFSAPPRESAEAGARLYEPLAQELSKVLGEKVTYVHPENWAGYSKALWDDKYDIIFDGPHFTAWRIVKKGHTVLARLPGNLSFYVVSRNEPDSPDSMDDLKMQPVCAISSPNMMASVLLAQYGPVNAPAIVAIKGGLKRVYESLHEGKCVAAVFRYEFVDKLSDAERGRIKVIFRSRVYPNQSISVSGRVAPSKHDALVRALTAADAPYTAPIRKRFGTPGMNSALIPAKQSSFEGLNELLEGVVWGW